MYHQSADYYDALYLAQKDYAKEAGMLKQVIHAYLQNGGKRLLDIACGTGLHLSHLQDEFQVEGMDLSADMIRVAQKRLPGVPLYVGDMADFSLSNTYDIITCMFGSVAYTKSIEQLTRAFGCMRKHLNPGGIMIIEPWASPEKWVPGAVHLQTVEQPEFKIARMSTSYNEGNIAKLDLHHLVGTSEGTTHFVEHHELALFTTEEMLIAFRNASLVVIFDEQCSGRGLFIAHRDMEKQ